MHLLCVAVLLPYLAMSAGAVMRGYAVDAGSLPGFLNALPTIVMLLFSWVGIATLVLLMLLIGLGVSARTRWFAAALMVITGVACVLILTTMRHSTVGLSERLVLAPYVIATGGAAWLATAEWPFRNARVCVPSLGQ